VKDDDPNYRQTAQAVQFGDVALNIRAVH
jgi:hypothetical protein